jgi:hypothetical protein
MIILHFFRDSGHKDYDIRPHDPRTIILQFNQQIGLLFDLFRDVIGDFICVYIYHSHLRQ